MYRSRGKYRNRNYRGSSEYGYRRIDRSARSENRGRAKPGRNVKALSINSLRQALWVLQNMEVGDGTYRVASSGGSGEVYEFTAERCSCEGFRMRGHCKHITAALLFQAVRAVVSRLREAGDGKGE